LELAGFLLLLGFGIYVLYHLFRTGAANLEHFAHQRQASHQRRSFFIST
jgi:ABC-type nickel/cobalt efflux system permease component RcnA